jgi:hypothetical protein
MSYPTIDIVRVANRIGIREDSWAGNCHGISEAILKTPGALRELVQDHGMLRLVRGHWLGPVDNTSYFGYTRGRLPVMPHSWLQAVGLFLMPDPELSVLRPGQPLDPDAILSRLPALVDPIIDPTRFAFDGRSPYIYVGPNDHYDPGGNRWREVSVGPCPPFNNEKHIALNLPAVTQQWISLEVTGKGYPYGYYTFPLCMWLANLSLRRLGKHAAPIFRALVEAGQGACIPMDNRNIVLGGS